jgi:hypothetical protein
MNGCFQLWLRWRSDLSEYEVFEMIELTGKDKNSGQQVLILCEDYENNIQ